VDAARRDPDAVRTVAVTDEGRRRVDAIRAEFDSFVTTERGLAATRQRRSDAAARRAIVAAAGGLAGSIILVVLFAGYLTGAIVQPVHRAADMAGRLAAGDLGTRMPERGVGEIGQRLVSLVLDLRAAEAAAPPELPELRAQLARVADGLAGALDDLREISRGIHPAILSEGGLGPALKALARRSAVPVELDVHVQARLPEQVEVAAYSVVSAALANAAKHAHASVAPSPGVAPG